MGSSTPWTPLTPPAPNSLVFWFGDLNFRIESYDLHFVKFAIDNNQLHQLWEKDQVRNPSLHPKTPSTPGPQAMVLALPCPAQAGVQFFLSGPSQLNMAKDTWPILKGFQEGPLNFAPTFKFDVGTNKYDTR